MHPAPGPPHIYYVTKDTPLSEDGEDVLGSKSWFKSHAMKVVAELNRAYLLGMRSRSKEQANV
jgi:hypothetical protein